MFFFVSLRFGHPYLFETRMYKKESEKKIEDLIIEKKINMLRKENKLVLKSGRLCVLRSILLQPQVYHKFNSNNRLQKSDFNRGVYNLTKDFILNSYWL